MHSSFVSMAALVGMSVSVWALSDIWRLIVLEIMLRLHRANRQVLVNHIIAAHMRVCYRYAEVDVNIEELSETLIEVIEPFME